MSDMTAKEYITQAEDVIEKCKKTRLTNTVVSHGFVVWNPVIECCLRYDLVAIEGTTKQTAVNPQMGLPYSVNWFTKRDAETVAADTKCGGDNVPAVAMFVNDAIDLTILKKLEFIAILKQYAEPEGKTE